MASVGIASIIASLSRAGSIGTSGCIGRLDSEGAVRCGRGGIGLGIGFEGERRLEASLPDKDDDPLDEDIINCDALSSVPRGTLPDCSVGVVCKLRKEQVKYCSPSNIHGEMVMLALR